MSLTVALDVTTALTQRAGVGRYTRELVEALLHRPGEPDAVEVRPFFVAPRADYPLFVAPRADYPLADGVRVAQMRRGIRSWRLEMLARQLTGRPAHGPWDGARIYHAPDVVFPPVRGMPVVATVHDLSYIVYPRYHTRLNGAYLRAVTPLVTRRARMIIADSEATKRDLVERAAVPAGRIHVVQPAVPQAFIQRPSDEHVAAARQKYGLEGGFILSVGTLEPRKNLSAVLRAYRLLHERLGDAPPLALVGGVGWGLNEEQLLGSAQALRVRRLGYVPDEDLAALYASCNAFVYPSLYEGWGLPVAEALSLGAPTITSTVSSLPEVAGEAALLVDPGSVEAITAALERVLTDTKEAERLRRAGPIQASRFTTVSWVEGTVAVYRRALGM